MNNQLHTAIIDLNAATGRIHIKDKGETVLGSAGHALELKLESQNTDRLKIILKEEDQNCFGLLKKFVKQRWPTVSPIEDLDTMPVGGSQVFLLHDNLDKSLDAIDKIDAFSQLGRSIFLFDPLRSVAFENIEKVARRRIKSFYQRGTEFIIFLFTSDLFLGRDEFAALPKTNNCEEWTEPETKSVKETDSVIGSTLWRETIIRDAPVSQKEDLIVELYKEALHKWFRYVLALPFAPKRGQAYHLFFCSNFETGIRVTRDFYSKYTRNPRFSPDNKAAYRRFRVHHPGLVSSFVGQRKPMEFKMLWKIIREHEDGICDAMCEDLKDEEPSLLRREKALKWLKEQDYLLPVSYQNDHWEQRWPTYKLNWIAVKTVLDVRAPAPLVPVLPSDTESVKQ